MDITQPQANYGSADWFTGSVQVTPIKTADENSRFSVSSVHFDIGARSAWHSHPKGQTLYVTEGTGVIQKRGESVQIIRPGDVIWTEPEVEHWHGACANESMTHIAMQEQDDQGNFANWGIKVTDEEYNQQPSADSELHS